ncbi:MAG TPA: hypothetical protein VF633_03750 [Brevundimonas sp.]|jgi:uncharacterized protein YdcH (DUF465 family)
MDDAGITSAFARIADEWDKAEKLIKTAEVTRNEVVIASINELRYAGRRLVDALRAADACRADPTCVKSKEDLNRYVSETLSFCQRALHDAVDAIILHVRTQIGEYESEFGHAILADKFPAILEIKKTLRGAEQLVILSREDRAKRASDYDKLATELIPALLEHCDSLEANRSLLQELVAEKRKGEIRDRKVDRRFWITLIGGAILGVIGAVFLMVIKTEYERSRALPAHTAQGQIDTRGKF